MVERESSVELVFREGKRCETERERELELVAERGKGLLRDFRDVSLFFLLVFFAKEF